MEVGVRELRDGLSRHLAAVREGAEVTVTDHGRPVARLVSYTSESAIEKLVTPFILREVRARAKERGMPTESLLSELIELGLDSSRAVTQKTRNGFPVLSGTPGHVVTDELVAEYRDEH
jgi:prevent-host-death family protein